MRAICLFIATLLLASPTAAFAQERRAAVPRGDARGSGRTEQPSGGSGRAQVRAAEPRPAQVERQPVERRPVERQPVERRPVEREPIQVQPQPVQGRNRDEVPQVQNQSRSRAVPRTRPRDVGPRTGVAVRREPGQRPGPSPRVVYRPRTTYNYYSYPRYIYSYPRSVYPYGYGAFGLGYFYYDPYRWHPQYSAGVYYQGGLNGYDIGELRLDVSPRDAEVWVDGYYAGQVDDFDGAFQSLRLESGGYRIELVAPGYEPLVFDVRIAPGRKTTYRGDLRR